MGNLKPGADYTYETIDGVTWQVETNTNERQIIGWDHTPLQIEDIDYGDPVQVVQQYYKLKEDQLWRNIRHAGRSNKTLQNALEECIIIYKLSEDYEDGI
jgi:hypothetical protein